MKSTNNLEGCRPLHPLSITAFSLIEIVLALGIISFALVGIMGLFPVAMKSALESQRETRAALIAQQIYSDLASMSGTNRFITTGTGPDDRTSISLTALATNTVYYSDSGTPLGTSSHPDALFLANVAVTPNSPLAGLSHIQTTIEAPAQATSTNRSKYTFVTLMNQM